MPRVPGNYSTTPKPGHTVVTLPTPVKIPKPRLATEKPANE